MANATDKILRKVRKQNREFESKNPIASGMFVPNHSGDHSAGRVTTTPTTDYEIANKKYVDDNGGGAVEGTDVLSTGEEGGTKFLREDGDGTSSWQAAAGGGDVSKVGTPANDQVGIWTGDGTIEGSANLTFDGNNLIVGTNITLGGTVDGIDIQTLATASGTNTTHRGLTNNPHSTEMIDDTTPELGGEMDCGAHTIGFTQQTATGDGTTTIDWKLGNKFKFTFGAQNDTFTFTAPTNPCNILLMLVQDGTGSRTATFPASVKFPSGTAPTLTTTASGIDIIALYYDGTNYFGVSSLAFS